MSLTPTDLILGLLCGALTAYLGFGGAVLVYRHAWAFRRAAPKIAFGVQAALGFWCCLVVSLCLNLIRLAFGWVPANADEAHSFVPLLILGVIGLLLMSAVVWAIELRYRVLAKADPDTSLNGFPGHAWGPEHGVSQDCPHCRTSVAYQRWLAVHDEPGLVACPECRQVSPVDKVFPPVVDEP